MTLWRRVAHADQTVGIVTYEAAHFPQRGCRSRRNLAVHRTGRPVRRDRVEQDLHSAMHLLAENPRLGHTRADVDDRRYRFWRVHSYLIAYRLENDTLLVIRVLHGSRDIRRHLHRPM